MTHASTEAVDLSVVIPVYNEEKILRSSVGEMCERLGATNLRFEIILAENGSKDRTVEIGEALSEEFEQVSIFSYPEPNYGGALREGIYRASGTYLVCEEIDLCDVEFHLRALELLRSGEADLVIGSKAMHGANDQRPVVRRVATKVYNGMLRLTLGFTGTDTHGLKAFRREAVAPVASRCIVDHDVFASELVIRAEREGIRTIEIPVHIQEKRAPSINLARRVPRVFKNLGRLMVSVHLGRATLLSSPEDGDPERPS